MHEELFVEETRYRFKIVRILLLLLFFVIFSIFLLYIFSNTAFASHLHQTSRLSTLSLITRTTPLPTISPSPAVTDTTSSNTPSQDSQVQFENGIATLTIEVAGVF